ncbi:EF-hand domain and EF-hand domain pair-containing protein [Strongyloides ratti]|uniref:EF-hand domain and EF-hand domain pair-containing protein n=1 Tax=Strongyloides ratti TaxID=34506 RepID=A0A090L2P0_STRRB|nr:EF-hand domain and EF-hand domain pair-containing protein [Strongyloides ratti]CEF62372.1 EF-hand domain and EF-hand domain pair-containing protein [Strongyloides ratti]
MFAKSSNTFVKVIDSPTRRRRPSDVKRAIHAHFTEPPTIFKNYPTLNNFFERLYWSIRTAQYKICYESKDGEFDSTIENSLLETSVRPPNIKELQQKTSYLFSEKWIKYMYGRFKNECPNGRMSIEDFKKLFGCYVPTERITDAYLERLFLAFAKTKTDNKDEYNIKKTLSFEDLLCALATLHNFTPQSYASWMMNLINKEDNETITLKEFTEFVKSVYELSGKKVNNNINIIHYQASKMFNELDADGDGLITYENFQNSFNKSKMVIPQSH